VALVTFRIDDEDLAQLDSVAARLNCPRSFLIRAGALAIAKRPELLLVDDPSALVDASPATAPPPPPPRKQKRPKSRRR
jgi:hypothetical protein